MATVQGVTTPLSVVNYGDPKTGKTLSTLYAYFDAFFVGPKKSAVELPALALLGGSPAFGQVQYLNEVPPYIKAIAAKGFKKVVIDDLSLIAQNSESFYKSKFENSKNKYAPWNALRKDFLDIISAGLYCGLHICFTAHLTPPKPETEGENGRVKKAMLGGPRLPLGMQEDLPSTVDIIVRTQHISETNRQWMGFGWPYVYRCGADADYLTGDRNNVMPDCANVNLGELMRASGYGAAFQRPAALAWLEPLVEKYAGFLAQYETDTQTLPQVYKAAIDEGTAVGRGNPLGVQWLLNDAAARAYLKVHSRRADPFGLYKGLMGMNSVVMQQLGAPAPAAPAAPPPPAPVLGPPAGPTTT